MIENTLAELADALRVHAASMAELAEALRNGKVSANEPTFTPTPVAEEPKPETAKVEDKKPEPLPEVEPGVKQPTLDDARKLVSRILKWHSANNAGNPCPLDTIFESVGAKRVQSLSAEQCATFCEQAEAFCKKAGA